MFNTEIYFTTTEVHHAANFMQNLNWKTMPLQKECFDKMNEMAWSIKVEVVWVVMPCTVAEGEIPTLRRTLLPSISGWSEWRSMVLRNVCILPQQYTVSQPRRPRLEFSPPWKLLISLRGRPMVLCGHTPSVQYWPVIMWLGLWHRFGEHQRTRNLTRSDN